MLRILIQGFVVVVCLCGGVLMFNHHGNSKGNKIHKLPKVGFYTEDTKSSGRTDVVKDLPFRSVPLDVLDQHVGDSAADILKLFFDHPNLTDEDVNSIMWMKSHQYIHGSGVRTQQRNYNVMSDVGESEEEFRDKAVKHHSQVRMSPLGTCSEPKPELEHVENPQMNSIRYYFPHCTILHRCRNTTGCCRRGYECGPKKVNGIEIIQKHFLVFVSTFDGSVVPDTKSFVETKNFINHTACECHKIKVNTNCHKKCPHQFRRENFGTHCRCTCKQNNKRCRHIYRGLIPLDEEDLLCIKEGKCLKPECHTGDFKVHTGFCPQFRHHHRHRHNS